ncbi:ion channel [Salibacteraceae bacterium]|jgi:inward rectifier potassium channel|nr:ion transporter [Flavobacteriales bacterium]MDB9701164.1 ion channel [Salibacteraceae bacterium]
MAESFASQDPGTGAKFAKSTKRIINKDGSFNVIRDGAKFRLNDKYLFFINISWSKFFLLLLGGFIGANLIFACLYIASGPDGLSQSENLDLSDRILHAFYFSAQTFTTVGYGAISPTSNLTNLIASFEAFVGFLSFALATGLLFGRFSKPNARIRFSKNVVLSEINGVTALLFRVVNDRSNSLMEVEARVLLAEINREKDGSVFRQYHKLNLQIDAIEFFPLTWTIVHPIDSNSPLHGKSIKDISTSSSELLIHIKGFDDVFSQTVHQRFSYLLNESKVDKKFKRAFKTDSDGNIILSLDEIDAFE